LKDARWHTIPTRICLLTSLLFFIYLGARRAVGAWFFRQGSPDAIQTAMRWDPTNPEYYDALGTLMHLYADSGNSNEIVQLYQSATLLSPQDAQFWADLGDGYDWAGRSHEALDAFQHARDLFPNSPEINWRLANFYVRAGKIPEAIQSLRMVLLEDGTVARRVFTLATNATGDREAILEMLPPQAPVFFDYINFQIEKGDIAGAEEVWARVLQRNLPFDLREEFDILNGGFDWRVMPADGAVVGLDSVGVFEGSRALRITFDGSRNIEYGHVFQYVPVQANTRYRFSGHMRVQGITTDSGPKLQVCDAYNPGHLFVSTENLVGTSGWSEQQAEFTTPADTHFLLVRAVRSVSDKLDNRIAGTVWIDSVRLNAE
jgi:hypothetical protein